MGEGFVHVSDAPMMVTALKPELVAFYWDEDGACLTITPDSGDSIRIVLHGENLIGEVLND